MNSPSIIRSILSSNTLEIDGVTTTILVADPADYRSGVQITNSSDTASLYVLGIKRGTAAPTVSDVNYDYKVGPGDTLNLAYSESIDLYGLMDHGLASTYEIIVKEVQS